MPLLVCFLVDQYIVEFMFHIGVIIYVSVTTWSSAFFLCILSRTYFYMINMNYHITALAGRFGAFVHDVWFPWAVHIRKSAINMVNLKCENPVVESGCQ